MIVIVDYGMGNLGSILNMMKKIGAPPTLISSDEKEIEKADKLILPGVGAFDTGMIRLRETGLIDVLNEKVMKAKTPTLGVCLGMQLITKRSDEGIQSGLGWIDAETIRFKFDPIESRLKIPHMGWNTLQIQREGSLYKEMYPDPRFYFVHSFYVLPHNKEDILTTTSYGIEFASSIQHEHIMATQFHPEKSHKFGMKLYKNFVDFA